jgi:hypothetical protein
VRALALEHVAVPRHLLDIEAHVEQPRGHAVDGNGPGRRAGARGWVRDWQAGRHLRLAGERGQLVEGCGTFEGGRRISRERRRAGADARGEQLGRPVDGLSDRDAAAGASAAGGDRDGGAGQLRAQRQGHARTPRHVVGRGAGARHGGHDRPARELLDHGAERLQTQPRLVGAVQHRGALRGERRAGQLRFACRHHDAEEPLLARGQRRGARSRGPERRIEADGAELRRDRVAVGGPGRGILGEHARHQIVETRGHVVPQLGEARGLVEQDLREDGHGVLAHERRPARQALEDHAAEREHVGARAHVVGAAGLLRRHVRGRSHHRSRQRRAAGVRQPRHAEVEELHPGDVPGGEMEVLRLEVAVHDAVGVRGAQRARDARGEGHRFGERERAVLEAGREVDALDPLHR